MKKKIILSAIMSICLCASLIAGATFAIFTSESKVNIAVTSGKVEVKAEMSTPTLYSPAAINLDGTIADENNIATSDNFANGGSAVLSGNTLTLDKLMPGDKVSFDITLKNLSNVKTLYRYGYAVEATDGSDLKQAKKLYSALVFGLDDIETSKYISYKTGWTEFTAEKTLAVTVSLPATAGNECQDLSGKIVFTIEAVQGNAKVSEGEEFEYKIADIDGFKNALDDINNNDETSSATLVLADDFAFTDNQNNGLQVANDKDLKIDLAGNDLTIQNENTDGITLGSGTTLTLCNSADSGKYIFNCVARGADGIFVSNSEVGKTTTLNVEGDVEINVNAKANSAIHAYAEKGNAVVNLKDATIKVTGTKRTTAIVVDQNTTLNITDATLDISCDFDSYSDGNDVVGILLWGQNGKQENINVNIDGNSVISVGGKNAFAQGIQIGMKNGYSKDLKVTMNGGEIVLNQTENGKGYAFTTYKDIYGKFVMNGGKISGNITALAFAYIGNVDLTVTGGMFGVNPAGYLADGYKATETNGAWTVTKA